jgi:hypothetical protein
MIASARWSASLVRCTSDASMATEARLRKRPAPS